tara:strand:- start:1090 stop:1524 length:435 start_codon:yes stop_codon:yes gene_type:complete
MNNIEKEIKKFLKPDMKILSCEINDKTDFLRIVIDSINSISIDDTSYIVKKIKNDDMVMSNFPNGLKIEVGTPGIDSSLIKKFQFVKNIGRKIKLEYKDSIKSNNDSFCLVDANDSYIVVEKFSEKMNIKYENIINAKVEISFA